MTRNDFMRRIEAEAISSKAFNIGADGDERYTLSFDGEKWIVYYGERGSKTDLRYFATESAALNDLFIRLLHDPTTRDQFK